MTILISLLLLAACSPPITDIYEPLQPPVKIGEYAIRENSELENLRYDMGVHWQMVQGISCIEFCNFNNRQINVKVILNEDGSFTIPMQNFKGDWWEIQIYQGNGKFTTDGFQLTYWGRQNDIAINSSLQGIFKE